MSNNKTNCRIPGSNKKVLMNKLITLILIALLAKGALAQKLRLVPQIGHSSNVESVAFSPNGITIASGSGDNTIKLWDVASGTELMTLKGHSEEIQSVAFSPEGKTIASGGLDKTIKLWDAVSGKELKSLTGHSDMVYSVAFSPDGKTIASGSLDHTIKIWDAASGKELKSLKGHWDPVRSVAFSPEGKTIASGSVDKTIKLWDVVSGKELKTLEGHSEEIQSVAFSPDGKTIASGSYDNSVKLWDVASGKELKSLTGHSNSVFSVAFSPDGKAIASGSLDHTIKIWDVASRKELKTLTGHSSWVRSVAFSPEGKTIASGSWDNIIKLWDVASGKELKTLTGHSNWVFSVAFSPDGKTIASGSRDKTIKLCDAASGKELKTLTGHSNWVFSVAFSPDGKTIASGSFDNTIKLWDAASGKELKSLKGHWDPVRSVAFSPDGKTIASGSGDKTIKLWDVASGKELKTLKGHKSGVNSVTFSPDGGIIASGSEDNTIKLWDVASGTELKTLTRHSDMVYSVTFSPDGGIIASGSGDKTIKLWDAASGTELKSLTGHSTWVVSVAFSPDGKTIASGSGDNTIKLWDVAKGTKLKTLTGQSGWVYSLTFSPDGKTIASGSGDNTTKLWDVSTGAELCSLVLFTDGSWAVTDPQGRFDGSNNGQISSLHWVHDGKDGKMEPIGLEQFSNFYYTPGLLAKAYKRETLPAVPNLQEVALYPELKALKVEGSKVSADFIDRGGGFGDVHIIVNGIDVKTVAGAANISVDLGSKLAGLVDPEVKVYAYNAQNTIRSREVSSRGSNRGVTEEERLITPKMVAVIGSVENYANPNLALNYSDDDAISVTQALLAMSKGLGAEIHIELVCDDPLAKTMFPSSVKVHPATKAGFDKAFRSAAQKAGADSAYLVYLSGHGAALQKDGGKNNEFFYLTRDARDSNPTSLANPEIAKQFYVSGSEIREYMTLALNCKRRFVILDTCSAGASKEELLSLKGEMEDLARARREFQQGTGTYALMGAAEGKASLEASEYGHGLLTYALLWALKNEKLGSDKSPDMVIASALLQRTQAKTKDVASAISRGQEPVAIAPNAGTVVLGIMNDEARKAIVLTSRLPLLLKPALTDIDSGDTALASKLAAVLRERSLRRRDGDGVPAFAAYLDQDSAPDAYRLQGTYSESAGIITIKAKVWRNGKPEAKAFPIVTGNSTDIIERLTNELKKWLGA